MIRIAVSPGERRVAVWDGTLLAARIERPARPEGVGDTHVARVTAVAKPLSGCFVETPDGDAFLPFSECPDRQPPGEGAWVRVRVTRSAQAQKGARVAMEGLAEGPLRRLARGPGAAERFAARWPEAAVEPDDAGEAARLRPRLGARLRVVPHPAFDDALESAFEELAERRVALPGGGSLHFHPTPALVAVDVDGGPHAPAEANAAALREVARQIALRELSGAILIDAAGLRPRERAGLLPGLAAALDPAARLLGLTPGGLIELRRARVWAPWHELTGTALAQGLAGLRAAAAAARAQPEARLALAAPRPVIAALEAMPEALAEYASGATHRIILRSLDVASGWRIEPA